MNQTRMKPPVALPEGVLAARQPAAANLMIKRVLDTRRYACFEVLTEGRVRRFPHPSYELYILERPPTQGPLPLRSGSPYEGALLRPPGHRPRVI